jgi:hypothetical protein
MTYRWPRLQTLVITAILAGFSAALLTFSRPVEMLVDGQRIETDVPPVTTPRDKVYVPLRSVAEALGAKILVEGDAVVVIRGKESLRVKVGDASATINGEHFTLAHAPFRVRGRVMIGLKPISDAFGVRTSYDAHTGRIEVVTP